MDSFLHIVSRCDDLILERQDGQLQGNKDVLFQSARWKLSWLGKTYFLVSANKGFLFLIWACLNYKRLLEAYVFTKFDSQEGRFTISAAVICFLPLLRWAARPQCLEIFFDYSAGHRSYSRKMLENMRRDRKAWMSKHHKWAPWSPNKVPQKIQWPEGRWLV